MSERCKKCDTFICHEYTPGVVYKYEKETGNGKIEKRKLSECTEIFLEPSACFICKDRDKACGDEIGGRNIIEAKGARITTFVPEKITSCVVFQQEHHEKINLIRKRDAL